MNILPRRQWIPLLVLFSICGLVWGQALDNHFTYQGHIKQNGVPFNGSCNFSFSLYAVPASGSALGAAFNAPSIAVVNGLFTAQLEFAANAFNGEKRWLEIQAECPAGSGSPATLSPRQELTAAPYAAYSMQAANATVAAGMPWSGLTGIPSGFADGVDNDTQYTAGNGLTLSSGQFSVNTGVIQQRVGGTCPEGSSIRVINPDGTVTCQATGAGGGVTAVTASAPLLSSGGTAPNISFTGILPIANGGTGSGTQNFVDLNTPQAVGGVKTFSSAPAFAAAGTPFNVSNSGLVTNLNADQLDGQHAAVMQQRVAGTCAAGSSIRVINPDGTVVCQTDTNSNGWSLTGNAGTNPAMQFLGTTDPTALEFKVNSSRVLRLEPNATSPNIIGGYSGNETVSNVIGGTIGGGGSANFIPYGPRPNVVTDDYGTIGGGIGNRAGDNAGTTSDQSFGTVGGGWRNTANGYSSTVGGGAGNIASGQSSTVGGGLANTASNSYATVGGGLDNTASGITATVGGGDHNTAGPGTSATVAGGGSASFECGPSGNQICSNRATGDYATVGGGIANLAGGYAATVPGGRDNVAQGNYSFAAGRRAKANNPGCFVLADSTDADEPCTVDNRFIFRVTGDFVIWTTADRSAGTYLPRNSSAWTPLSDRNAKTDVMIVDGREVLSKLLQIPLSTWRFKAENDGIRHMGPMAQDFYAAFGLGEDEKYISTIDADGVALAAIQGLYHELKDRDAKIATLEARLTELEQVLKQLAAAQKER